MTEEEAIKLEASLNRNIAAVISARRGIAITALEVEALFQHPQVQNIGKSIGAAYDHLEKARLCLTKAKKHAQ